MDINQFKNPEEYKTQLETIQSQFPAILTDFQKYYVSFNKNPDYPEYETMLQNIKSNLNNVNSQLFTLSNDIQTNIDQINQLLIGLNTSIEKEKKIRKKLRRKLGVVEDKNNASIELIADYKEMYESGYLRNWGIFFCILIAGVIISKTYKNPNVYV